METTELQLKKPNSQFFLHYTDTISSSSDRESSYHRISHKAALVHAGTFMLEFIFKTQLCCIGHQKESIFLQRNLCFLPHDFDFIYDLRNSQQNIHTQKLNNTTVYKPQECKLKISTSDFRNQFFL